MIRNPHSARVPRAALRQAMVISMLVAPMLGVDALAAEPSSDQAMQTLVRGHLLTLRADKEINAVVAGGALAVGRLFKDDKRVAIALATSGDRSLALALYLSKDGDWTQTWHEDLAADNRSFTTDNHAPGFSLEDLNGDRVPEVLLTESQGATGNRLVSVYRYDPATVTLVCAARSLCNPRGDAQGVSSLWKSGPADNTFEHYLWVQTRLLRDWSSEQSYLINEYLIGSGEPAVRVRFRLFSSDGKESHSWLMVGNLGSARNLIDATAEAGSSPQTFRVQIDDGATRRDVELRPRSSTLRTGKLEAQWSEIASHAVFDRPEALAPDMALTLADQRVVKLGEVAEVGIAPAGPGPSYQLYAIRDDQRKGVDEPASLPALAVGAAAGINWEHGDELVGGWGKALVAGATPIAASSAALLYLRLPNVPGQHLADFSAATTVTALTVTNGLVRMEVAIDPEKLPRPATKDLIRPLIVVSLGQLANGAYRVEALVRSSVVNAPVQQAAGAFTVK